MRKIPCLFEREFMGQGQTRLLGSVTPGCEWATTGGAAMRKRDGTACMVRGGQLFRRYDAKRDRRSGAYKVPPVGAEPCGEPDPVTGHWPHWVAVGDEPESRWHRESLAWVKECADAGSFRLEDALLDGTYECCGPKIGGNNERFDRHVLISHASEEVSLPAPRTLDSVRRFLERSAIEGVVFHHPDGRMCKVRRRDLGLPWPVTEAVREVTERYEAMLRGLRGGS